MISCINSFEGLSQDMINSYILGQDAVQSYFNELNQELDEYFESAQADYWIDAAKEGLI